MAEVQDKVEKIKLFKNKMADIQDKVADLKLQKTKWWTWCFLKSKMINLNLSEKQNGGSSRKSGKIEDFWKTKWRTFKTKCKFEVLENKMLNFMLF